MLTDEIRDKLAEIKEKRTDDERFRIYECGWCDFLTLQEDKAKEHGLDYRNALPDYACLLCVDTFHSLSDLEAHEAREHYTEKVYSNQSIPARKLKFGI